MSDNLIIINDENDFQLVKPDSYVKIIKNINKIPNNLKCHTLMIYGSNTISKIPENYFININGVHYNHTKV